VSHGSRTNRWAVPVCATLLSLAGCAKSGPSTDAERLARGRELVKQMCDKLASAQTLSFNVKEITDRVRRDGGKETLHLTRDVIIRRPDRFYSKQTGDRNADTWYDGKRITVAMHNDKVFAQARTPETIDGTLDAASKRYGVVLPIGDLLYSQPDKHLLAENMTGGYQGTEKVEGTDCHHLRFVVPAVDWELWLPEQGDPLPKRLKVVQKKQKGEPVADIIFTNWNLSAAASDETFDPKVPQDYEGIALIQRASTLPKEDNASRSRTPAAPAK
jgi:hypothetical protein